MPFEALETIPRDKHVPMASISYERPARGKNKLLPRLIVAIPTTLAGMCKPVRFVIEIGTGADAGKARVTGVPKGVAGVTSPGTMMKNSLVIRFGEVPALGTDAAAKEACRVEKVQDHIWDITLPAWFKIEPAATAVRKVKAA